MIKAKGSLLPSAPEAEETEFPFRSTGMYPTRLDSSPNPRAGPGAGADVSPVTGVMGHEPWKQGDLVTRQAKTPR